MEDRLYILSDINMLSANAYSLNQSKLLSCVQGLRVFTYFTRYLFFFSRFVAWPGVSPCVNFFFSKILSETTNSIFMKRHRNDPVERI